MHQTSLAEALRAWKTILGAKHVSVDSDELRLASTATFATASRVLAILRPGNRADVQQCVRIAHQCHVSIFPVSSGKNWGYGSRVPAQDGVLLDLGRLNRIVDYNEDLAYVTIEPGVTQGQLYEYLQAKGGRLWMDATGASPDCSIIGNTLERGFGHTPMGDHCANSCAFEVVLPTGECVETGFARFENAKAAPLSRWGVGPSLDGLFAQSNLGIVTRITVWLMPAPQYFQAFFFKTSDPDGIGAIVDALRPLRLDQTLRSVVHIGNDFKVLTGTSHRPFDGSGAPVNLTPETMSGIRATLGIGCWNGSGGLYGTKAQVREARRRVQRALRGKVDRLQFVDDRFLALLRKLAGPLTLVTRWDVTHTLGVLESVYGLMKGKPTRSTLASVYWPKKNVPIAPSDPDRDACGLLWCSPVVPNTGADVSRASAIATDTLLRFGFQPQISVSLASERIAICVVSISYDRAQKGADARAAECYRVLTQLLIDDGYPPYRLNVNSTTAFEGSIEYTDALRSLKEALDPHGVLSPGRYTPVAPRRIGDREGVA